MNADERRWKRIHQEYRRGCQCRVQLILVSVFLICVHLRPSAVPAGWGAEPATDWPALVQKPYAGQPAADLSLKPLLVTADGKKIATKDEWEKARQQLHNAWMERLGKPPAKPDRLDVKVEETTKLDGLTRQRLSFHSEGDDRAAAYLLVPAGLKEGGSGRPCLAFNRRTGGTLRNRVGPGGRPELAYALELGRGGYVTLRPSVTS